MGGDSTSFEDLPEPCIVEILRRCNEMDILKFQAVSSWACTVARTPFLWKWKLEKEYQVALPDSLSWNYSALQRLHRRMFDRTGNELLHFRGVLTDGGVQEDRTLFWVDNMFARKPTQTYCSAVLERDVRCVAVHRADKTPWDYSIQRFGEGGKRTVMYDESFLKDLKERPTDAEEDPLMVVTQQIIIGRMGDISCPVSCGVILLGDFKTEDGECDEEDTARHLYSEARSEFVDRLSGMKDLEKILEACKRNEISPPHAVGAKNMGEWVEFGRTTQSPHELQPALWFRFFQPSESREGYHERWEILEREFKQLGTECKFTDGDEAAHEPGDADQAAEAAAAAAAEQDEDVAAAPEAPEVHLWQEAISLLNATHRFMEGREHMVVNLERPFVGNFACAMLVSCENWMAQTWERGGPNIDVNFVYMLGKELLLGDLVEQEREECGEELTDDICDEAVAASQSFGSSSIIECPAASQSTGYENDSEIEAEDGGSDEIASRMEKIWFGTDK